MPDVIALIEREHRQVEALFQNFRETGNSALVSNICDELDAHAAAEEQAFYPVVRDDVPSGRSSPAKRRTSTARLASSSAASKGHLILTT